MHVNNKTSLFSIDDCAVAIKAIELDIWEDTLFLLILYEYYVENNTKKSVGVLHLNN